MAGTMDSLNTLNTTVRTLLAVVVVGGIGFGSWWGYHTYYSNDLAHKEKDKQLKQFEEKVTVQAKQIEALEIDVREKELKIAKLETANRLLKVDHRLGRLEVLDQGKGPDGKIVTRVSFVELDNEEQPLDDPKVFDLLGEKIYVDYWLVKFDDKYIEESDLHRSTSICLFQRVFGDLMQPFEGKNLDEPGVQPKVYSTGGEMSDFEKQIWGEFWTIANDKSKAQALGIRAAHGQAVSIKAEKGKSYRLTLRSSDGLSLTPEDK